MPLSISSSVELLSGYSIPLIGLGVYQNKVPAVCKDAVLSSLRYGYRHVDSAHVYIYHNEGACGEAIAESSIDRAEIFFTSKCVSKTHGYESTLAGVETSLKTAGLTYIDLFLIHDPLSGTEKRLATYKALLEKQKEGKIRSVGVSNYGVHHLKELAQAFPDNPPTVNQIELHPFCQQKDIVAYCKQHGIVVEAYSPLTRAIKFDNPVLQSVGKKHSKDLAQVLVRWSLQSGYVVLPKSEKDERIKTNAHVYDFELDAEDMKALNDLDQGTAGALTWNPVGAA